MLNSVKERLDREDEGFTLIELMVVVLIIAILLAIAIPTFLGARNSANSRAAQSNLRNALTAEQEKWTSTQSFDATTADMTSVEGSLTWTTGAPTKGNVVSVGVDTSSQYVILGAWGADGNCYYVLQSNDPTKSFTGYQEVAQDSSKACPAAVVPATPTYTQSGSAGGANIGASGSIGSTFYGSW